MPKKQLIYLNNLWKRKDWLNAAKILFELPNSKVLFPNCEDAFLDVKDIYFDELNADLGGERYIFSPKCNKYEAILIRAKTVNFGSNVDNNS